MTQIPRKEKKEDSLAAQSSLGKKCRSTRVRNIYAIYCRINAPHYTELFICTLEISVSAVSTV